MRRAGLVAFAAVDAGLSVAANFDRAESGDDAHQCAVWAEKTAPEVLDQDREHDERRQHHDSEGAHVAEEVEHLDVCHDAERGHKKIAEVLRRHGENNEEKESQQKVLEAAQGRSSQAGKSKLRRNSLRPSFHRYSETVPTGQSQEQNDFFTSKLERRKTQRRTIADGWMAGMW